MSEKKRKIRKSVYSIAIAAYLKLFSFEFIGKKNKCYYFEINEDEEANFDKKTFEYTNSVFATFDHHILTLKHVRDYLPEEE